MKKGLIIYLCILSTVCLFWACDVPTTVPVAKVNFTLPVYSNNLVRVGGYEYVTGAIKGLVIYRSDMETFYAYDRACPYDWKEDGYVVVDSTNSFQLICENCQSTFSISTGYPIGKVKADAPLRPYRVVMIDDFNIRVSNWN